jgi:hypothetical protein
MKRKHRTSAAGMRAEYRFDYSKAERGKYHGRLAKDVANVVILDPDVAEVFRSSRAVNDALRSLMKVSESIRRRTGVRTRSRGQRQSSRTKTPGRL